MITKTKGSKEKGDECLSKTQTLIGMPTKNKTQRAKAHHLEATCPDKTIKINRDATQTPEKAWKPK